MLGRYGLKLTSGTKKLNKNAAFYDRDIGFEVTETRLQFLKSLYFERLFFAFASNAGNHSSAIDFSIAVFSVLICFFAILSESTFGKLSARAAMTQFFIGVEFISRSKSFSISGIPFSFKVGFREREIT